MMRLNQELRESLDAIVFQRARVALDRTSGVKISPCDSDTELLKPLCSQTLAMLPTQTLGWCYSRAVL